MNMQEFIEEQGVTMTAERTSENPNMDDSLSMDHWRCVLKRGHERMTLTFSMGHGFNGEPPTVSDVLPGVQSDTASVENANGFEDWCDNYGYDPDSRRAERIYKACERQAKALKRFMGEIFDEFMDCEE